MIQRSRRYLAAAAVAIAVAAGALAFDAHGPQPARAQSPETKAILTFSVGGVLTADGTLWQYIPEKKRWYTIDEAFRAQGKETHILPLPVAASEITDLATWGFLITRSGTCWLYDIEQNKWGQLPSMR